MGLRDIGARLPPGFRFYPSDEELVCHYLYKKIVNEEALKATLVEIDLHTCEPWQLPEVAKLNTTEWYFFSFRDRKYATGYRTNRATITGYWKATGKDRVILDPNTRVIVGMRKTLVFYRNRAPNGIKTGWIMHEFRLESPHMPPKEDWVLCRVFHKSKAGENNNNNLIDQATASSTSSDQALAASPPPNDQHHTYPCGCQQPNSLSSNNPSSALNHNDDDNNNNNNNNNNDNNFSSSSLNPNDHVLHHPKEGISTCFSFSELINLAAEDDDDYGFLWDMDLEDTSKLGEGVGDVKFDDDGGIAFF